MSEKRGVLSWVGIGAGAEVHTNPAALRGGAQAALVIGQTLPGQESARARRVEGALEQPEAQ